MLDPIFRSLDSPNILVDMAALMQAARLLLRDQLALRVGVLTGRTLYGCYYYFALATPLWNALFWAVVLGVANLSMIIRLLLERTTFSMSAQEKRLFVAFPSLSPGEFRRLLRICRWREIPETERLTTLNAANDTLFYIMDGQVEVSKGSNLFTLEPGCFIGEVSFLLKTPATATVEALPGTLIARWQHADLDVVLRRHPAIRVGIMEIMNVYLAAKVGDGMRT